MNSPKPDILIIGGGGGGGVGSTGDYVPYLDSYIQFAQECSWNVLVQIVQIEGGSEAGEV